MKRCRHRTVLLSSLIVAGWLIGLAGPAIAASAAERRPNFIYVIIDELGYYEQSMMGHPELKTPNIDRLAAEGTRFSQFLAGGPVCAPTRCCLMTGKHAGHSSLRTNAGWEPIRAGEETIASLLKRAGYACGGFGKWGCGARGTAGVPETHGFDLFFGYYDQVHAHTFFPTYLIRNSAEVPLAGNTGDTRRGQTFSQYRIVDEAKKFLRENHDRPFFLYLPWTPPHGQWGIPEDDPSWQLYKDKPWQVKGDNPDAGKIYAAMVNMDDRHLGEILGMLKELGVDENTVVFFSGDNGGNIYFPSDERPDGLFGPNTNPKTGERFRGSKGNLYEGGLRVPFIVRWPGKVAAGRVSDHLGYFPDVLPTIAELAGLEPPAETDGISIAAELLGATPARPQQKHEYLYWEYGPQVAVRYGQWKAIRPKPKAEWELYDLATDIEEKNDVAADNEALLKTMVRFADEAHEPMVGGELYDHEIANRDRSIPLGRPYPPSWGPGMKDVTPRKKARR